MTQDQIRKLLESVRARRLSVEDALKAIKIAPFEQLENARVDHHRSLRCGFPEVVFCQGKETSDIAEIARSILAHGDVLLATRAGVEAFDAVKAVAADAVYHERARCITVRRSDPRPDPGLVQVVSAGTADIPVAEEARVTVETSGHRVRTVYDAGVAGIHRLLGHIAEFHEADAIVVVAGMEGALASVVGGLVDCPVIAVPTSVGYGTSLGGLAPLLTMLNSCASGVAVVNIDNGFGAGYIASQIASRKARA